MYSICKEFALRNDNLEKNLIKYKAVKGGGKGQFLFLDNFSTYSRVHNILRHFDVWPNFLFTSSETKRGY